jgi:ATP-binding cassette subfamily D (ALD) long-chain fatty acid import protein
MAVLSTLRGVPTARLSEAFHHYYARLISRLDQLPRKGPLSSRTARLIATIAFSLAIVTSGYGGFKTYKRRKTAVSEAKMAAGRYSCLTRTRRAG